VTVSDLLDRTADTMAAMYLARRIVTGGIAAERNRHRRPVPILNLHRIADTRLEHRDTLSSHHFRRLVESLQRVYRFISLADLDRVLATGENREDLMSLTFDDSYGCNYVYAVPILRSLRVPATFFVSSGYVDSERTMPHDTKNGVVGLPNFTSTQLRQMAAEGFEIGSHSVSHHDFSKESDPLVLERELEKSRETLEGICGLPVTRFAVPWGSVAHCTPALLKAAAKAGYERVYSHFGGRNLIDGGRVGYVLHRICSQGEPAYVRACLEGYRGRVSYLPDWRHGTPWAPEFHAIDIRRP